ncbi:N-acetylglucosaminyl-phosphatidylinositol de-N-acetylase-like [Artemia franciscana]|uniref:N-acetylglucosaminyl-phosphatidylinositol de-N-acetylase-like n=1 Tax=Artemia franciscana TaxID=6661 RepID=UPI0032DBCEA2
MPQLNKKNREKLIDQRHQNTVNKHDKKLFPKNSLFVTAHPDDECMFYGPTIIKLIKNHVQVYILCFSSGVNDREKKVRKGELQSSCQHPGIDKNHVSVLDSPLFPDSIKTSWPVIDVATEIENYIFRNEIQTVYTFDEGGVSGLPNHISLYKAVRHLVHCSRVTSYCKFYCLKSVPPIQKYIFYGRECRGHIFAANNEGRLKIERAIQRHASQYVWFRKVYITFSVYTRRNVFFPLN